MAAKTVTRGYYPAKYNRLYVAEPVQEIGTAVWFDLGEEYLTGFTWTTEKTDDSFAPVNQNNPINVRMGYSDSISAECKRFVGGPGQKLLLTKDRGIGEEAHVLVKGELADGSTVVYLANADVTNRGTETSGNTVAGFAVTLNNAQGDPTYTEGN